jgi:glyoxylase-like metal-dependent hydrolase (beta-lactamase superfamily II)
MRIGEAELTPVLELEAGLVAVAGLCYRWDPAQVEAEAEWLYPRHVDPVTGMARLSHHSWLLRTGDLTLLVDPCIGNSKPRPFPPNEYYHMLDTPWLDRLATAGAHPDEIDLVVCTHLHPDHCGWNTQLVDGRWTPTFPNARYVLSAPEVSFWERFAREPDRFPEFAYNRGVLEDSVAPVLEAGLVELLDDGDSPAPGVTVMATPGHTAGHWSVCYADRLDGVCFSGDTLHSPVHVLHPEWSLFPGPGSNYDHQAAAVSRRAVLDHCATTGHVLAPAHFQAPHACRVAPSAEGRFLLSWMTESYR